MKQGPVDVVVVVAVVVIVGVTDVDGVAVVVVVAVFRVVGNIRKSRWKMKRKSVKNESRLCPRVAVTSATVIAAMAVVVVAIGVVVGLVDVVDGVAVAVAVAGLLLLSAYHCNSYCTDFRY